MMTQSDKPFDHDTIMEIFGVMLQAIFIDIKNPSAVSPASQVIFDLPGKFITVYIEVHAENRLQMVLAETGTNEPLISVGFPSATDCQMMLYSQRKVAVASLPTAEMFKDAHALYEQMAKAANVYIAANMDRLMGGGP